ncbi:acid-sensing ion channel 1-like isoform X1 [Lytechinus variegatus]|uniref:acid-sensing ion channel 1-like isoform X1 n=2 Tax=Lytechinus variegatus TaxID=7654 RepID=UPI001BB245D3|nr:acid-sensing ion channel 1-like isoform X1 [Lytechinus variegatus]
MPSFDTMPLQNIKVEPMKATSTTEKTAIPSIDQEMIAMKRKGDPRSYNDRMSWLAVFYKLIPDGIGVAGLRYAFNPREIRIRRSMWLLLVLIAFCFTSYQIVDRILYFASHPKDVDINIEYRHEVPFPSVAICNINIFRRGAVNGTVFEDFLADLFFNGTSVNMTKYRDELEQYEMTETFREMGHDVEMTIKDFYWSGLELSLDNFTMRNTEAGVCIVFNDIDNGFPQLMASGNGPRNGLYLKLKASQDDYYFHPFQMITAGFQVLLYDYGTEPVIERGSFGIAVGMETHVAVDITEYYNLPRPHGLCENKTLKYFDTYGYSECALECASEFILERCNCNILSMNTPARECNAYEFFNCINPSFGDYVKERYEASCHCPVPCFIREYSSSVSILTSPSQHWSTYSAPQFGVSPEYFRNNICSLVIFMKDLSVETISQQIKYPFFSLLCDIGGSLGLWLGGSILTVFEVFDLFSMSTYVYSKMNHRR